jgi:hypothetical protein
MVATLCGPTMFCADGVVRALNRKVEGTFDPPTRIIVEGDGS